MKVYPLKGTAESYSEARQGHFDTFPVTNCHEDAVQELLLKDLVPVESTFEQDTLLNKEQGLRLDFSERFLRGLRRTLNGVVHPVCKNGPLAPRLRSSVPLSRLPSVQSARQYCQILAGIDLFKKKANT